MLRHYLSVIRENIHMQRLYATDLLALTFYKIIKCWFGLFIHPSFTYVTLDTSIPDYNLQHNL